LLVLKKGIGKFLDISKTLTMLLKLDQHPHDKFGPGPENEHHLLGYSLSQTNLTSMVTLDIPHLDASIRRKNV